MPPVSEGGWAGDQHPPPPQAYGAPAQYGYGGGYAGEQQEYVQDGGEPYRIDSYYRPKSEQH